MRLLTTNILSDLFHSINQCEEKLVLSFVACGTIQLIKENLVHAHLLSSGYNNSPINYI
ncbi:hypothetical protein ORD22_02580 [Sporosarcina sp. GW1-11]|uniref:hypothetical protein n=1 Tax=Sporosarcina sp. GW1-11 TaxID=2899126 RepID=UPI00294FDE49|nr:hypothetical protein [Sporosarcina sp. GW1-11]MDV6377149.1 hypothetical protein [Sporosarcina sp. GW1-11]